MLRGNPIDMGPTPRQLREAEMRRESAKWICIGCHLAAGDCTCAPTWSCVWGWTKPELVESGAVRK